MSPLVVPPKYHGGPPMTPLVVLVPPLSPWWSPMTQCMVPPGPAGGIPKTSLVAPHDSLVVSPIHDHTWGPLTTLIVPYDPIGGPS